MATTDEIIARIKRRLSRSTVTQHDAAIADELLQTQEWLEGRATLPSWILVEGEEITIPAEDESFNLLDLQETFLRFYDDEAILIQNPDADSDQEEFVPLERFESYQKLRERHPGTGEIRGWAQIGTRIYFRQVPELDTTLRVRYYFRADPIAPGNETVWTTNASELIIAHTGLEIAQALRDRDAIRYFEAKRMEAYRDYIKRLTAEEVANLHSSRGED